MNNAANFILALKEFFFEFLGYFFPGLTLLLMAAIIVKEKYLVEVIGDIPIDLGWGIFLAISYVLGYVIYGAGIFIDKIIESIFFYSFKTKVKNEICSSKSYKQTYHFITDITNIQNLEDDFSTVRNLAMSFVPNADKKIYTVMFRAELAKHVSVVMFLFGFIGIIMSWVDVYYSYIDVYFKTTTLYLYIYISLIICSIFLYNTRRKLYKIAMKLIFPIFLVEYKKQLNNER